MRALRAILAGLYGVVLRLRHWLYNIGWKRSARPKTTTICVGNLTAGGTGKTPMVEFLVERLGRKDNVAVLSRGYGRKTKGYREVQTDDSFINVGDEPKQIKRKFPQVPVIVCEDRIEGVAQIEEHHSEVSLIIMDDGFQHRAIRPHLNIVLMDYTRPIYEDRLLPRGRLRDLPSQIKRADMVVVTKTPPTMKPLDRLIVEKWLKLRPFQGLYFTTMVECEPAAQFPEEAMPMGENVFVMSGIGNPAALETEVAQSYKVVGRRRFGDHHRYRVSELVQIAREVAELPDDTVILTTEKDAVKLTNAKNIPPEIRRRLYVLPIKLFFPDGNSEKFIQNIYSDVKENTKRG